VKEQGYILRETLFLSRKREIPLHWNLVDAAESRKAMRILTKEDGCGLAKGKTLDTFIAQLSGQLELVKGAYSIPIESGRQTALSKLFAYLLFRDSEVCVYITGWGVATEHLDLFYGYRRSVGETRRLIEAPVHLFEPTENEALISLLCIVFYFFWDAWVFDLGGRSLLRISHDGWLEIRVGDEKLIKDIAAALEDYKVSILVRQPGSPR
jgi:hypothetical protein